MGLTGFEVNLRTGAYEHQQQMSGPLDKQLHAKAYWHIVVLANFFALRSHCLCPQLPCFLKKHYKDLLSDQVSIQQTLHKKPSELRCKCHRPVLSVSVLPS